MENDKELASLPRHDCCAIPKFKKSKNGVISKFNAFDVVNYAFLFLFAIVTLYPLYYVVIGSFNNGLDYTAGGIYFWPRKFSLENYIVVFNDSRLLNAYIVTILRVVIGTITSLLFTSMVGYAMSRRELKYRNAFYWFNVFTMFFGGGLIPYFLVIKSIGLFDSFWVYIIPSLYSVYNMIIFSSFFRGIPDEIRESAIIDGASEFRIWLQLIIPLSKPVIATVALWVALGHWNSFFDVMIYTNSPKLQTLQYYLLKIIKEASIPPSSEIPLPPDMLENISPQTVTFAAIIISTLPIMFMYPFIAKHFTKGVMIGSLKG